MAMDLRRRPVISIDLSPAGNILATGSGDWQARICAFLNTLYLSLSDTHLRVIPGSYQTI